MNAVVCTVWIDVDKVETRFEVAKVGKSYRLFIEHGDTALMAPCYALTSDFRKFAKQIDCLGQLLSGRGIVFSFS